jgi:hypothetical protein
MNNIAPKLSSVTGNSRIANLPTRLLRCRLQAIHRELARRGVHPKKGKLPPACEACRRARYAELALIRSALALAHGGEKLILRNALVTLDLKGSLSVKQRALAERVVSRPRGPLL